MKIEEFRSRLHVATTSIVNVTRNYCFNDFSSNYLYLAGPYSREKSNHLTNEELVLLTRLNRYENVEMDAEMVIKRLHFNNTVPLYIDTLVFESTANKTVIKLSCSRRFRGAEHLNYKVDGVTAPFHLQVAIPYWRADDTSDEKWDVNWQKELDLKKRRAAKKTFWPFK